MDDISPILTLVCVYRISEASLSLWLECIIHLICSATNLVGLDREAVNEPTLIAKDNDMLTISTLKSNFRRWARIRNTIRELSSLSDRDLNDLGISRSDIRFVAKRSVAR